MAQKDFNVHQKCILMKLSEGPFKTSFISLIIIIIKNSLTCHDDDNDDDDNDDDDEKFR